MNPYRSLSEAPRGPRWIRRRALRSTVRVLAFLPTLVLVAAILADATWAAFLLAPLAPSALVALVPALLRFATTSALSLFVKRKPRKPITTPFRFSDEDDGWVSPASLFDRTK